MNRTVTVVWNFTKYKKKTQWRFIYLYFVHHFMYIMTQTLLKLESNTNTLTGRQTNENTKRSIEN